VGWRTDNGNQTTQLFLRMRWTTASASLPITMEYFTCVSARLRNPLAKVGHSGELNSQHLHLFNGFSPCCLQQITAVLLVSISTW